MIWNKLKHNVQQIVIERVISLLETEENPDIQDGLISAVHELEVSRKSSINDQDPFCENGWES